MNHSPQQRLRGIGSVGDAVLCIPRVTCPLDVPSGTATPTLVRCKQRGIRPEKNKNFIRVCCQTLRDGEDANDCIVATAGRPLQRNGIISFFRAPAGRRLERLEDSPAPTNGTGYHFAVHAAAGRRRRRSLLIYHLSRKVSKNAKRF